MDHKPAWIIQTEATVEWPESGIEQDLPLELRVGDDFGKDGDHDDYKFIYIHEEGVEYDVTEIVKLTIDDIIRIVKDENRISEGY